MSRLSIEGEGKQNPTYTSYIVAFLRNTDLTLHYPYTARIMRMIFIFPLTTASVERTSSLMKRIRIWTRGRMADETLRKLMFIALNLPKDGIGHTLMGELIEDYCLGCGVSRLSPQEKEKDAQNNSDSDSDSDTERSTGWILVLFQTKIDFWQV